MRLLRRLLLLLSFLGLTAACGGASETEPGPNTSPPSAQAEDVYAGCVPSELGTALRGRVSGAILGSGPEVVVYLNTADGTGCDWIDHATAQAEMGRAAVIYDYADPAGSMADRLAELDEVINEADGERVALVGGSRGGCLALVAAADRADVVGTAVLSCAKVWNREDPVPIRPYLDRVSSPVLELIGSEDLDVSVKDVRDDAERLAEARVKVVRGSSAHGEELLAEPGVRQRLDAFLDRVLAPAS